MVVTTQIFLTVNHFYDKECGTKLDAILHAATFIASNTSNSPCFFGLGVNPLILIRFNSSISVWAAVDNWGSLSCREALRLAGAEPSEPAGVTPRPCTAHSSRLRMSAPPDSAAGPKAPSMSFSPV